jgi:glucose-6-phosphate 1-dehydrogenase
MAERPSSCLFVIIGATGDLMRRKLLPAGAELVMQSSNCAERITYEPGGRGFKSCRARQTNKGCSDAALFHF